MKKGNKKNVEIILLNTKHPGNIGSAARAMKNMGFTNMRLVNPVDFKVPEVYMLGWNSSDIFEKAKVYGSLKDALADVSFVVGTTARKGKARENLFPLEDVVKDIVSVSVNKKVAILFGSENNGLVNEEIKECHKLAFIDTDNLFGSLNLSQAVLVVCYELHKLMRSYKPKTVLQLAGKKHLDEMYAHLDKVLSMLGYGIKGNRPLKNQILKRLKAVFSRAMLEKKDVQMIRGICTQIEKKFGDENE